MSTTSGSKLRIHKFEFDPSDQFRSLTLLCTTLYLSINICFQDVGGMLSLANQGYRGKRWKLIYSGIFYSLIVSNFSFVVVLDFSKIFFYVVNE